MQQVTINLGQRSYDILIAENLLTDSQAWLNLPKAKTAMVVTNTTVDALYRATVVQTLQKHYAKVLHLVLPDGEEYKTWESLNLIFDALLQNQCDRKTVLFALGGGVVGDMTGFAAASYMRGVPFVQIPTTLLAQVDSSVGGKTAINHPLGKNMIGAFYQPERVICDISCLQTLAPRELAAGLAEVIKYGPIADMAFFAWIEENITALQAKESQALAHAIQRSCEIKAQVVSLDEREGGLRAILNFGHTFGHAIEAGMGYGAWLHGEAVACGMLMASVLSQKVGLVDAVFVIRLKNLLEKAHLPTAAPNLPVERYLELMQVDKKAEGGEMKFVLIDGQGKAFVQSVDENLVVQTIEQCVKV